MADQDPFRTFKSWHRSLQPALTRIDPAGIRLEKTISKRIPVKAVQATRSFVDFLEKRPLACFLFFFVLVCSRAFHWLINPQFYIEDGKEFYAPAFNLGFRTIARDYASYYHVVPRILSLIAAAFPVRYGPLMMEMLALSVQAVAASFLLSGRLAKQFPSSTLRFGLAFVVIGFSYSNELFGNVAHSQWYLGILSVALICSEPGKQLASRIGDYVTLTLNCLTGPFAPVLAVVAWSKWRGDRKRITAAFVVTVGACVTAYMLVGAPRTGIHKGSRLSLFERIVSNQIVVGPIRGFHYAYQIPYTPFLDLRELCNAVFGIVVIALAVRKGPPLVKALAALGVFSAVTSMLSGAGWALLGDPGVGERYFFYLGLLMLYSIYVFSVTARYSIVRWGFRIVLAFCALGAVQNWIYDPPFSEFNYGPQIAKYDQIKKGEKVKIRFPIDRKLASNFWTMDLIKK
jgi:hypothetical protein